MFASIGNWFSEYWYWAVGFVLLALFVFLLLRLQSALSRHAAQTIVQLLQQDPALCLERLEHNKRLRLLFRKPLLELWRLDAYMALGDVEHVEASMQKLNKMRLEPKDKLEFYQKSLSFYAGEGNAAEARAARDRLKAFLKQMGAEKISPYAEILDEADLILGIYIDHNTVLIQKLIGRAAHTKNELMRGVTQYRIAKLAYFKGDVDLVHTYLARAEKNLKGTWYAPIIAEALEDPSILNKK